MKVNSLGLIKFNQKLPRQDRLYNLINKIFSSVIGPVELNCRIRIATE